MNDTDANADAAPEAGLLPEALRLTAIEARILGCLIEKEATTPEQYPLTENALTLACNQKTSREPLMDLTTGEVGHALRQLEPRHYVRSQHASRAQRYEHRFSQQLGITSQQQAVLCVLMLRGPQTLNEIFTRGERIGRFKSVDEVIHALERLAQRTPALTVQLPRASGQREDRWTHLLSGPISYESFISASPRKADTATRTIEALETRIDGLEARIAALESLLKTSTEPPPEV